MKTMLTLLLCAAALSACGERKPAILTMEAGAKVPDWIADGHTEGEGKAKAVEALDVILGEMNEYPEGEALENAYQTLQDVRYTARTDRFLALVKQAAALAEDTVTAGKDLSKATKKANDLMKLHEGKTLTDPDVGAAAEEVKVKRAVMVKTIGVKPDLIRARTELASYAP